jgi:hypothetical protein
MLGAWSRLRLIPDFDEETGYLPLGIHDASLQEIRERLTWSDARRRLFSRFEEVLRQLFDAGVDEVFIGGSFATGAPAPNDIDAFWPFKAGLDLSKIDPVLLNMDERVRDPATGKRVRPMKLKYGVELFVRIGPNARINGKLFHEFFGRSRDGLARGLIRLVRSIVR